MLAVLGAVGLVLAAPASVALPVAAPVRAASWKTTKLYGVDYVSLPEVAERFGLKAEWVRARDRLKLRSPWTELVFERDKRELRWNGIRVDFGEPVITHRRTLWMAEADIRTTLEPLLRPSGAAAPNSLKVIVLDPGHGGTDPGTQNRKLGLQEKVFTLDVAQRLKPLLAARGYRVLLTRETDTRFSNNPAVDLPQRAEFANQAKADLFLSIHFNAFGQGEVHGVETYTFTPAGLRSTAVNDRVPADEQAQPVNRYDHWSLVAASAIQRELLAGTGSFDRGVKRTRWWVLRPLRCPGVLIEGGFLSNEAEARKINTPAHRQKIAEAIAAGVDAYAARLREARPAPAAK